jgi:hypothetical protein
MKKLWRNRKHKSDGAAGPTRSISELNAGEHAAEEANVTARLPIRQTPRKSASQTKYGHEPADESSEDDLFPIARRRGHDFRNVQTQDNARVQLGDNTYITNNTVYSESKQSLGANEYDKRISFLKALEYEHMNTRHASIKPPQGQTCQWLFDDAIYNEWRQASHLSGRQCLWIKGKPGAGKSTIMKLALEKAKEHFCGSIVASFFFNARGSAKANTTEGMYRCLLYQIISKMEELPSGTARDIDAAHFEKEGWPVPILQNLLHETISSSGGSESLVCFIDALDECEEKAIREVLRHLEELQEQAASLSATVRICLASRHYPDITIKDHHAIDLDRRSEHQHDISRCVQAALRIPDSLGVELGQSIVSRCAGVFLWAVLTIQVLNQLNDQGCGRSKLKAEMDRLPDNIQDIFKGILEQSDKYTLPLLRLVLFSVRPLELRELYFALMTSTDELTAACWDKEEISYVGMRKFILTSCKGLLEFPKSRTWLGDNDDLPPQLIHESLRDYLLHTGLTQLDSALDQTVKASSHARLAEWCLAYLDLLSLDLPSTRKVYDLCRESDFTTTYPFLKYAVSHTADHVGIAYSEGTLSTLALGTWACLWLTHGLPDSNSYKMASVLCLLLDRHSDVIQLKDLYKQGSRSASIGKKWRGRNKAYSSCKRAVNRKDWPMLQAAADASHVNVVQLFQARATDRSFEDLVVSTLVVAAAMGLVHVADLLLMYGHN